MKEEGKNEDVVLKSKGIFVRAREINVYNYVHLTWSEKITFLTIKHSKAR